MPYAPELGFWADAFQLLSFSHSQFRYLNWRRFQPKDGSNFLATRCGAGTLVTWAATRPLWTVDDAVAAPASAMAIAMTKPAATIENRTDFGKRVLIADKVNPWSGTQRVLALPPRSTA
jgi:hypothetical protein